MMESNSLEVKLFDQVVGYLSQEDQSLIFNYDKDYLDSGKAISLSLALQEEAHKGKAVEAFFSGFLPEAEIRTLLAKKFGISEENDYALLNKLGGECAGAISVGTKQKNKKRKLLSSDELEKYFRQIPQKALLSFQEDRRLSLAGAQNKLVVVCEQDQIYFPASNEYSSHILKPVIHGYNSSVHNEAFCMILAKSFGLKTANVEIKYANEVPYLLIERYDRHQGRRLHQEDFSQALGVLPKYKYESEGGPNLQDCFKLVRDHSRRAAADTLLLLELVIFNFLIANNDAHAKNFSLLYRDGLHEIELSPTYDLLCTAIYPNLSSKMAMRIGKEFNYRKIRPSNWQRLAEEISVNPKYLSKKTIEIKNRVLQLAHQVKESLSAQHPSTIYDEIIGQIEERSKYCF